MESARHRGETRVHGVKDIALSYEGRNEQINVRPPNLSAHGMFINTARVFPEGAVLSLRFRLAHTDVEVRSRCEVRHCIPGVGVGVEFIGMTLETQQQIAREIAFETAAHQRPAKLTPRRRRKQRKAR